jgi:uncharacterized membrane protein
MRPLAHALVFLIIVWVVALLLAPVALLSARRGVAVPALLVYAVGERVCHQRPERSFHVGPTQLPVCARCTGLYASSAAGAIAGLWAASSLRGARARRLLLLASLPTGFTWTIEMAGLAHPSNLVRAAAALPLGFAAAWMVVTTLRDASASVRTPMV